MQILRSQPALIYNKECSRNSISSQGFLLKNCCWTQDYIPSQGLFEKLSPNPSWDQRIVFYETRVKDFIEHLSLNPGSKIVLKNCLWFRGPGFYFKLAEPRIKYWFKYFFGEKIVAEPAVKVFCSRHFQVWAFDIEWACTRAAALVSYTCYKCLNLCSSATAGWGMLLGRLLGWALYKFPQWMDKRNGEAIEGWHTTNVPFHPSFLVTTANDVTQLWCSLKMWRQTKPATRFAFGLSVC